MDGADCGAAGSSDRQQGDGDGGFGLAAMRSRARELGGSLTVETSPGDGTAVAARLPAPRLDDAAQVVPVSGTAHREDV